MNASTRHRRTPLTLLTVVALLSALLTVPAAADHTDGPLVTPTVFAGNDSCTYKFDPPNAGTQQFDVDGTLVTITITRDGQSFGFTSSHAVEQVIAKGGPNYNLYDYTGMGITHDSGLTAPINPKNGQVYGLSHISFCFGDAPITPEGTLDVEKDAAGSYDRELTWDLDKSVAPATHAGGPGDTFSSDWEVVATLTDSGPQNFLVEGEITVGWSGDFPVSVRVEDELDDGTIADVDCGGPVPDVIDFAAGTDEVVCTYEASPSDAEAETNVVELIVLGTPAGDITGQLSALAPIVWTETVDGDEEVDLADDRSPFPTTPISSSTTWEYDEGFECPAADSGAYEDGSYVEDFPNTATLTGDQTDLEAEATVTVTCTLRFQGETVTGAGLNWSDVGQGRTRTNTWFQYTNAISGTHDLVQGRKLTKVGTVTITPDGADTDLCFTMTDPWMLDPGASSNVKVHPLASQPTAWMAPGSYSHHFTRSGDAFCVTVPTASYGYAIHLDAGYWTS